MHVSDFASVSFGKETLVTESSSSNHNHFSDGSKFVSREVVNSKVRSRLNSVGNCGWSLVWRK